eukprot:COSAG02_NODE_398_length_23118_cov_49.968939_11_plen_696_part_00
MVDAPVESHGKLVHVSAQDAFHFHLVFSNKTESDTYCLAIWTDLTARGVQVWQQKKNIPKDSDNWFSEWFPSANVAIKIVCFLTVAYLKSIYCMKEFRVAQAMDKLLVVVCEPMQDIRAVDPGQYPHASDALAYLMGGGQVIFHDADSVVSEIVTFLPRDLAIAASQLEPEPELALPQTDGVWPAELKEFVSLPSVSQCLMQLGVDSLDTFAENVDLEDGHDAKLQAVVAALPDKPKKARLQRNRVQMTLADLLLRLRIFEEFDTNQTGLLSRVDCMRIPVEKMHARAGGPIGDQFDAMDSNRDGRISFSQLFSHAVVSESEAVPPAKPESPTVELQTLRAQRALEEQRVQLEEKAAALQRQQSAVDRQAAAVEAEKQLAAQARVKAEQEATRLAAAVEAEKQLATQARVKAEQEAARLAAAVEAEKQLATQTRVKAEQEAASLAAAVEAEKQLATQTRVKAEQEAASLALASRTWTVNARPLRSQRVWEYTMQLREQANGKVSGSGTFGEGKGGPFKLDGVRKGDQLSLTQTFGDRGKYNKITFTVVPGDGKACSLTGKWCQMGQDGVELARGETNARPLADRDFNTSRTWTVNARPLRSQRVWEYTMQLREQANGKVSGSGTFGEGKGGPFKLDGVRKGDQLSLTQTFGDRGKYNKITFTVVPGDGKACSLTGKWCQMGQDGVELARGESNAE